MSVKLNDIVFSNKTLLKYPDRRIQKSKTRHIETDVINLILPDGSVVHIADVT